MKRRQICQYFGTGLITTLTANFIFSPSENLAQTKPKPTPKPTNKPTPKPTNKPTPTPTPKSTPTPTPTNGLNIQWLGHTCFMFTGSGKKVLVNPFETKGCTANYQEPKVTADLVLVSSFLLDEGAVDNIPGEPKFLFDAGLYKYAGLQLQGINTDHDRFKGKRFGNNIVWKWQQTGINILHLGGSAAPIDIDQQILMGRPDVLLIPVGGSAKAYNPQEAKQAIEILKPKLIIPTHYLTELADKTKCDLVGIEEFLKIMSGVKVNKINSDSINITAQSLPQNAPEITVLQYKKSKNAIG